MDRGGGGVDPSGSGMTMSDLDTLSVEFQNALVSVDRVAAREILEKGQQNFPSLSLQAPSYPKLSSASAKLGTMGIWRFLKSTSPGALPKKS